ncbi:MAG: hypothetical protein HQM08_21850 [Candidatus Riflebacteria bacterium]|nr:hypothetical protein [Candidatus Riflebacteria bacterium]
MKQSFNEALGFTAPEVTALLNSVIQENLRSLRFKKKFDLLIFLINWRYSLGELMAY